MIEKERFLGTASEQPNEMRTIVLAPTGRDAELMFSFISRLEKPCQIVRSVSELCVAIAEGAGAAIVAEEVCGEMQSNNLNRCWQISRRGQTFRSFC